MRRAKLSGWGRHPMRECGLATPRDARALSDFVAGGKTLIARGNGRAYGDAALNAELTLSMLAMDRMRSFDAETGRLTCEAGALLADIIAAFVPRGWFPPVVPGTRFVTVGGLIAADVHGKNQHLEGCFGAHVEALTLVVASGETLHCDRCRNTALFHATIGGMGLTGVILTATFRLRRIPSAYLVEETLAAADLAEALRLFEASADAHYSVAWVDCLARGARLGRALLSRGAFAEPGQLPPTYAAKPLAPPVEPRLAVPFDAPASLLNRYSVRLFNALLHRRGTKRSGPRVVHFSSFFFPLDGIRAWNRLYGRRGLVQYQCVLPAEEAASGLKALLRLAAAAQAGSFLAVLKQFGGGGEGLLSFPMRGYALALDFPVGDRTLALVDDMDRVVHEQGGRVYLAKDALSTAERLRRGYPGLADFQAARDAAGAGKFSSALAERLAL